MFNTANRLVLDLYCLYYDDTTINIVVVIIIIIIIANLATLKTLID